MIQVDAARFRMLDGVGALAGCERISLEEAAGRVLTEPLRALLTQPPFSASAMDGYAVRAGDVQDLPATLKLIGEAAAGHGFKGTLKAGEAVRIFTGAPLPDGADAIVIQENTQPGEDVVVVVDGTPEPGHVRPAGGDFSAGDPLIPAGRRLTPRDVTLAAAMGHGEVDVRMRPRVAILATGDELVAPGCAPGVDQVIASNGLGLAAMVRASGGIPHVLGIARDTRESLDACISQAAGADVLVTIGGASVGDHDLVGRALQERGMALDFWRIAMRPGKPLMFGRLGRQFVLGLPGNPVSALICGYVFLVPLIEALLGLECARQPLMARARTGRLTAPIGPNGPRLHLMRAQCEIGDDGMAVLTPARSQDSSLLSVLAQSNAVIIRQADTPGCDAGQLVDFLAIEF